MIVLIKRNIRKAEKEDESRYELLMQSAAYYVMEKNDKAADKLVSVDPAALELPMAVTLYNKLAGVLFAEQSAEVYQEGHKLYSDGYYEESLEVFAKALTMNPENLDAIYFTGRAYHRLGDIDTAIVYYNKLVSEYPDSGRAKEATERLSEIPAQGQ